MRILRIGRVNPKRCQQCSGIGIVTYLEAPPALQGRIQTGADVVREKVCPKCKGIGVVDVPGFERLSMKQIEALVKDKSVDDIIRMFKGMTPATAELILRKL